MSNTNRRTFMRLMGLGGAATLVGMKTNIAKALAIAANNRTGTIQDVEHIVILMQENHPFDHHFGTMIGVRGFNDPRAIKIHLPLLTGGSTQTSVFLQPAGPPNTSGNPYIPVPPGDFGGPSDGVDVTPPFRVNPDGGNPGLTYLDGTNHGWEATHACWNWGQYDSWPATNGAMTMSYQTRKDIPYHYALADAFMVGDAYHSSIMGPTNPNRMYLWSGCVGNVNYLGSGGTDGHGAGPATYNGLSVNNAYWVFKTFPEVLEKAGISWKVYQDLAGSIFSPDFGDGTGNSFAGNYTDNPVLYFNQYATAPTDSPLFQKACTGTQVINMLPAENAPDEAWMAWTEHLFDDFRSDVKSGKLPQVSWIVGPAGYTEHPNYPVDYGAWYISQVFDILVSNPELFSKTVFIVNFDEADGSFDHILPPTVPFTSAYGASTVSIKNEIVTTSIPNAPIGLNCRVPFLVISPWSKGGYVNSQVFDHTSVIQFIEKRFGVLEANISPWRRAVCGDLTSCFNFANPNDKTPALPSTDPFLPPAVQLAEGGNYNSFVPDVGSVMLGIPQQEQGIRPAKALPYEMDVRATVDASNVVLTFYSTGEATVVFQVRSGIASDLVRTYTVEPGKQLSGTWSGSAYDLSVYGPNGFVRYFKGSTGFGAAALRIVSKYGTDGYGSITWKITNALPVQTAITLEVTVVDAYTGNSVTQAVRPGQAFGNALSLEQYFGWYDLIVTVAGHPSFNYRLAGHVETGRDSFSDPAMGGLVTLQG
jgi:phospholipase C